MLGLFRKKSKEKTAPQLVDIHGNQLEEGDTVMAHRYELGKSKITLEGQQYFYKSIETGKKVSYVKMIDAITGYQKVDKIVE